MNEHDITPLAFDYLLDDTTVLIPHDPVRETVHQGVTMAQSAPIDSSWRPSSDWRAGSLSIPDAIAISVSVLAPGMAMFLNVPGVAAVAGGSTPLAFLLGGIACLALAFVVIGFTRRMASAGYAYTYASRSLGKPAGFVAGWMYAFGLACFVPMTMAGVAYLFADLVGLGKSWWFPLFLIGMALLVVLSIIRIKVTTRLQLLVGVLTVVLILIVNIVVTAKGGAHGNTVAPFTFCAHGEERLQRRLLRHHPRHHVLHRLRDRGRLRRGDEEPAPRDPDRDHRGDDLRDPVLPLDDLQHVHRRRRRQAGRRTPRHWTTSPAGTSPAGSAG